MAFAVFVLQRIFPIIVYGLMAGLLILFTREWIFRSAHLWQKAPFRFLPALFRFSRWLLAALIFIRFSSALGWSVTQYLTWKGGYFLPPHQPLTYFFGYVWQHFAKEPMWSLVFAGVVFLVIKSGNVLSGNRFFYDEEPYLASIGILAAGWPKSLIVGSFALIAGLLAQLILTIILALRRRPGTRFPLVFFWVPFSLIAISPLGNIIGEWLKLTTLKI